MIGDNFYIRRDSFIETNCKIGNNVIFANRLAPQIRNKDYNWKGLQPVVIIEDDVWVGVGSIILSGIKIGFRSIIAARYVVTTDVESMSIYAGVPARKISGRFNNSEDEQMHIKIY